MKTSPLLVGAVLLLASCATAEPKLAVCDGKHRRPANPYGSVLSAAVEAKGAPTPAAPSSVPAPAMKTPRAGIDPKSAKPCGAGA